MTANAETRALVEGIVRKLLSSIGADTLEFLKENGFGVTLFAFTFDDGAFAYISTAERTSMISSLKQFLAVVEAGLTTDPPGERGQA